MYIFCVKGPSQIDALTPRGWIRIRFKYWIETNITEPANSHPLRESERERERAKERNRNRRKREK